MIYDLKGLYGSQLNEDNTRKGLKVAIKESEGILWIEVRLAKKKAVRSCTDAKETTLQVIGLLEKC